MSVSKKKLKLQKRYILDCLGSKTAMQLLRCLYANLHLGLGLAEIAKMLRTSRANIYRKIPHLKNTGIIRYLKKGRKTLYKIDTSSPLALPLFEIFNYEIYLRVNPAIRNCLALLISNIKGEDIKTVVLFGSHAKGLATSKSDIDLCVVHSDKQWKSTIKPVAKEMFAEAIFEIHEYAAEDFEQVSDFVVLDSLLTGVPLTGIEYFFKRKENLKSIDKNYLIYRLEKCKENLKRARKVRGEGRKYFESLVEVSLGELEAIIGEGKTVAKQEISVRREYEKRMQKLHERIAELGDKVWLE